ncbi:hypothetical protein BDV12DRAFT_170489 [Aspergillus spectabilis]
MDNSHYVQTIVRADLAAYIYKSRLEELLERMFRRIIPVRHEAGRFEFFAPSKVIDDDLMQIVEVHRVH